MARAILVDSANLEARPSPTKVGLQCSQGAPQYVYNSSGESPLQAISRQ